MTGTLLHLGWLNLKRDRVALALTFVLPLVFFSIFAGIFGGMGGDGGMPPVELVVVDEDGSEASRRFAEAILAEEGLKGPGRDELRPRVLDSREEARALVEKGACDVALVLEEGFGAAFGSPAGGAPEVVLYADTTANPVAHQVVQGLLQQIAMTAAPDLVLGRGIRMFEQYAGGLTDEQEAAVAQFLPMLGPADDGGDEGGLEGEGQQGPSAEEAAGMASPLAVEVEDVRRRDQSQERRQRLVAFYAAGIGVMFLLFSMSGAASSLLKEEQTGTLDRLLDAGVGMGRLLAGYWAFAALVGCAQVTLMFVWGWAVFGLELFTPEHLAGFAVMTPVTAAAAAAFGLALGTACRSTAQLGGLSTLLILVMSALGGSMFPRFLMRQSPLLDKLGLLTFNAWAIDGYQKVFWYETGLLSLWPQVLVLLALTAVLLAAARLLARRWEAE